MHLRHHVMFKKILRMITYNGDEDNICGDGDNVTGMGWGWGCKFIPMSVFNLYPLWSPTLQGNVERFSVEATSNVDGDSDLPV